MRGIEIHLLLGLLITGHVQCQTPGFRSRLASSSSSMLPSNLATMNTGSRGDQLGGTNFQPKFDSSFGRMQFPSLSMSSLPLVTGRHLTVRRTIANPPSIQTMTNARFLPNTFENVVTSQGNLGSGTGQAPIVLSTGENVDHVNRIQVKNPDNGFVEFTDPTAATNKNPETMENMAGTSPNVAKGNGLGDEVLNEPGVFRRNEVNQGTPQHSLPIQPFGDGISPANPGFKLNGNPNWNLRLSGGPGPNGFQFTNGPGTNTARFMNGPVSGAFPFGEGPNPNSFRSTGGQDLNNFPIINGPGPNGFQLTNDLRSSRFLNGPSSGSLQTLGRPTSSISINRPLFVSRGNTPFSFPNINQPFSQGPLSSNSRFWDPLPARFSNFNALPSAPISRVDSSIFPRSDSINPLQPSATHLLSGSLLASDNNFLDSSGDSLFLASMLPGSNSFRDTLLLAGLHDNIDLDTSDRFWLTSLLAQNTFLSPQTPPTSSSFLPFSSVPAFGSSPASPWFQNSASNQPFPIFTNGNRNFGFARGPANFRHSSPSPNFGGNFLPSPGDFGSLSIGPGSSSINSFARSNFMSTSGRFNRPSFDGGLAARGLVGPQLFPSSPRMASPPGLQFLGAMDRMFSPQMPFRGHNSNSWNNAFLGSMLLDDTVSMPTKVTRIDKNVQPITVEKSPSKPVKLSEINIPAMRRFRVPKDKRTF